MNKRGVLLVVVGPSGCGKGTVLKEVLAKEKNTFFSVSATTRAPREGEIDGIHYRFLKKEQFEQLIQEDGLLEYTNYVGNYYGTPKAPVMERLERGENVVLEIEVEGATNVRRLLPEAVITFLLPPSMAELRRRLTDRGTEAPEVVERRLSQAARELPFAKEADYVVINDTVEEAVEEILAILKSTPCKGEQMQPRVDALIAETR